MIERAARGFALPLVLWALVVLGGLATAEVGDARTDIRLATGRERVAEARAAADSGAVLAAVLVEHAIVSGEPLPKRLSCPFAAHTLMLELEDEAGKIDLNRADPVTIAAVLAQLQIADADRLAQRIADFRDADSLRRPGGAEMSDYARLGLQRRPRNGPLLSLRDLRSIPGGSEIDLTELSHHATVHGAVATDPSLASEQVRAALLSVSQGRSPTAPRNRTITVRTTAMAPDGTAFHRSAILRLGRPIFSELQILDWQRGSARRQNKRPASPSCPTRKSEDGAH